MNPCRLLASFFLLTTLLQSGCTLLTLGKAVTSPIGAAAVVVKESSKVAAKSVETGGKVTSSAVVGTGRVVVSGMSSSSRVSAASVDGAGRVAASGVGAGSRVSVATVRGTGQVAAAGVGATGDLTAATITSLAKLSRAGMVTFVDFASGTVVRVPWRPGLNIYGSSMMAKVTVAERALAVIRGGRLVYQTAKALASARGISVQPGDVLRLADTWG